MLITQQNPKIKTHNLNYLFSQTTSRDQHNTTLQTHRNRLWLQSNI